MDKVCCVWYEFRACECENHILFFIIFLVFVSADRYSRYRNGVIRQGVFSAGMTDGHTFRFSGALKPCSHESKTATFQTIREKRVPFLRVFNPI